MIDKSTKQLHGAYRKLFLLDGEIYIKHPEREVENFEKDKYNEIFLITVNVGEQFEEYEVADKFPEKQEVIIFNKETFRNALVELDTIADLVHYFKARSELLSSFDKVNIIGKESDMLALYMLNVRSFPIELDSDHTEINLHIRGEWDAYDNSNRHIRDRREADKISYFVDELCEKYALKLPWGEELARILLSSTRLERRSLSENLHQMMHQNKGAKQFVRRRHFVIDGILYVLVFYSSDLPEEQRDFLMGIVGPIYMYKSNHEFEKVVVIGGSEPGKQYKFGLVVRDGTINQEGIDYYENLIRQLGWFTDMKFIVHEIKEFPNEED